MNALAIEISAIIPVYNRGAAIGAAIDSILAQDGLRTALEIIVVDDGSDDDLAEALQRFAGRIRVIRHDRNYGAAAARNTGVAAANGEYLAFLDSDDVWLPKKLAAQIAFMEEGEHAASCTACLLARPGAVDVVWPRRQTGIVTRVDLVWGCFLSPGTTMLCKATLFREIGMFDTSLRRHEDWDWLLRLTARYDLGYLDVALARREPSAYADLNESLEAMAQIGAKHLVALPPSQRRHLQAAIAWENAAAYFRGGNRIAALAEGARSLWLAPRGNPALVATIARRFGR